MEIKTPEQIIKEVSQETDIPEEVIKLAYKSSFQFIRNTIEKIPIKDINSQESLNEVRTSFNLPEIGKLYTTYDKIEKIRRRIKFFKDKNNGEDKED